MSGQNFLPKVFAALARSGLTYRWMLCYETGGLKSSTAASSPNGSRFFGM